MIQDTKIIQHSTQEIIYIISHDMGAPLRSVVQFSELLSQRMEDRLDDKERYWFSLIKDNGEKAQNMLDAMLVLSRLSNDDSPHKRLSVKAIIEESINEITVEGTKIDAIIDIADNLPQIQGNHTQLVLFFKSLLKNALLYHPKDYDNKKYISISYVTDGDNKTLYIEDNGIGVDSDKLNDISTIFKRLHADSQYPGIGMGLAYCERIAEQHNGSLRFECKENKGLKVGFVADYLN